MIPAGKGRETGKGKGQGQREHRGNAAGETQIYIKGQVSQSPPARGKLVGAGNIIHITHNIEQYQIQSFSLFETMCCI